jgi:hypothetical protein
LWLLVFAATASASVVTYSVCPGCIPRDRVNSTCEWTGDAAFAFEPENAVHRTHLIEDAQLAEELGIRYADAENGRRTGVEGHGGLREGGRVTRECLTRMFHAIETTHGATPGQIVLARRQRLPTFDIIVGLLFVPFYAFGVTVACRWIRRRLGRNDSHVRWIATGLASVAVAVLGAQAFRFWGAVWEMIRVGNGHLSSVRAASQTHWIQQYGGVELVVGLVVFWLMASLVSRGGSDVSGTDARSDILA